MISIILSAFLLGIAGSLHCLGMCGPLVMSLPFKNEKKNKEIFSVILYHLGKTTTYTIFGFIAGSIGKSFVLLKWQQSLTILAGVFLLAITLLPFLKNKLSYSVSLQHAFQRLQDVSFFKSSIFYFFAFGILNGLLPCGLVYTAMAASLVMPTPWHGMLFMFFFGLGTIPSLTSIILFKNKLNVKTKYIFQRSSLYISIVVGVLLILRGLNLGIPYISPSIDDQKKEVNCCYKP